MERGLGGGVVGGSRSREEQSQRKPALAPQSHAHTHTRSPTRHQTKKRRQWAPPTHPTMPPPPPACLPKFKRNFAFTPAQKRLRREATFASRQNIWHHERVLFTVVEIYLPVPITVLFLTCTHAQPTFLLIDSKLSEYTSEWTWHDSTLSPHTWGDRKAGYFRPIKT